MIQFRRIVSTNLLFVISLLACIIIATLITFLPKLGFLAIMTYSTFTVFTFLYSIEIRSGRFYRLSPDTLDRLTNAIFVFTGVTIVMAGAISDDRSLIYALVFPAFLGITSGRYLLLYPFKEG